MDYKYRNNYYNNYQDNYYNNYYHNHHSTTSYNNVNTSNIFENVNTNLKQISKHINKNELIDNIIIENIINKLKTICENHNKKINDWFDDTYIRDLNNLRLKNNEFNELIKKKELESFIICNKY